MRNSSCHQPMLTFSRFGNANRVASDALENLATLSNILLLFVLWDRLPLCSPGCPKMYNSLASATLVSDDRCEPSCLPLKYRCLLSFYFIVCFVIWEQGFAHTYGYASQECPVPLAQRASNSLKIELQMVMTCHRSAGNWTLVLWS